MMTLKQLSFERNNRWLFNQLETSLAPGELLIIQGINGSGKSTLLRLLAGFLTPHAGDIEWYHHSISCNLFDYQNQLHYMGHENSLRPSLTISENWQWQAELAKTRLTASQIQSVANPLTLTRHLHTPVRFLSQGQARKASLARLLLFPNKPLWILDEPTTSLDTDGQTLINELLDTHLKRNHLAIIATHQTFSLSHPIKTIQLGETPA